jgi:hypothetical protein
MVQMNHAIRIRQPEELLMATKPLEPDLETNQNTDKAEIHTLIREDQQVRVIMITTIPEELVLLVTIKQDQLPDLLIIQRIIHQTEDPTFQEHHQTTDRPIQKLELTDLIQITNQAHPTVRDLQEVLIAQVEAAIIHQDHIDLQVAQAHLDHQEAVVQVLLDHQETAVAAIIAQEEDNKSNREEFSSNSSRYTIKHFS